jgi:hypothetical protein
MCLKVVVAITLSSLWTSEISSGMSKIDVHITHEHGGTIVHAKMDTVPRVGDQVNISTVSGMPAVMIVRKVIWVVHGETSSVGISVAEMPPAD